MSDVCWRMRGWRAAGGWTRRGRWRCQTDEAAADRFVKKARGGWCRWCRGWQAVAPMLRGSATWTRIATLVSCVTRWAPPAVHARYLECMLNVLGVRTAGRGNEGSFSTCVRCAVGDWPLCLYQFFYSFSVVPVSKTGPGGGVRSAASCAVPWPVLITDSRDGDRAPPPTGLVDERDHPLPR